MYVSQSAYSGSCSGSHIGCRVGVSAFNQHPLRRRRLPSSRRKLGLVGPKEKPSLEVAYQRRPLYALTRGPMSRGRSDYAPERLSAGYGHGTGAPHPSSSILDLCFEILDDGFLSGGVKFAEFHQQIPVCVAFVIRWGGLSNLNRPA